MTPEIERQNIAARLVMGALYNKCGFTPVWFRIDEGNYPYRYECLLSILPDLAKYGISPEDIIRLAGPMSPYWEYKNDRLPACGIPLRTAAWLLEQRSRRLPNDDTERAFSAVWKYMTGYDGYGMALGNESERRVISEMGIYLIDEKGTVYVEEFLEEMHRRGENCLNIYVVDES